MLLVCVSGGAPCTPPWAPPSPPRLDFVDSENDAAREPEGQGVSPMVCTNEPFIPEDQEPTLTSVQLKKHQLAKMSGEKTEGGDGRGEAEPREGRAEKGTGEAQTDQQTR